MVKVVDRDIKILHEITRWRFCLGRQIRLLCEFSGQRACDRRLAKLIKAGYIERKYLLYGMPGLYFATPKAVKIFNLAFYTSNVRIEQIQHDTAVIDTAIYFIHQGINSAEITTERELKHLNGFGNPKHDPDFVYKSNGKTICVEVELSTKKQATIERNIKSNYSNFDVQQWVVPSDKVKILQNIETVRPRYSDIEVIPFEEIEKYVGTF